ncbi:TonB-dependent receptor [Fulvivirga sp. RKSG066]|uniref:TonB-dependent receptor n=1 Tax=Fulvivirga aurantia TaxID=2529383 RepID=UPI0012BBFE65|nr:TonB-dependent receptor [Fulvivirga aurantia]MTI21838.1 TonB-dependent receptor [Fulvivirga aurantia]
MMIFKKLLFTVALVCCALNLLAQLAILTGNISDKNGPLPGANIISEAGKGTSTDALGNYRLKLTPGTYNLKVSFIGYESQEFILQAEANQTYNKDFDLVAANIELADVTISTDEARNLENISTYDIKLRPVKTSQDVLRAVPGLFIAQHAGGGKAEQIFLRGFDIDHGTDITLSVDGMPVNMVSHAHGQGYSDLHFVIPETIERVNFNKGPYYANQGNFNTAGYAAFDTKSSLDNSMIKVEGGQFGTLRSVAMLDLLPNTNAKQDFFVASEFYITDGYFKSEQNFSRLNLFSKYTSHFDDGLLQLSASTFTSQWDASGQIPVRAVRSGQISRFGAIDDTEGGETSRSNINLKYIKGLSDNQTLTQQLYFSKYDFRLVSNFTFFLNDPENGDQITQSESRKIYGYKGSYLSENYLGQHKLTSEVGGGIRYDDVNDISLSHTLNRKTTLEDLARGDIDEINLNAFASETLNINKLSVNASLRYDYIIFNYVDALNAEYEKLSETKGIMSPKLRLNYQLTKNTNVFAKAGVGFHSNDTRVVVARNGNEILPKAYGIDIGAIFKPTPNLAINTALWHLDLEQEFVYVGDEGIVEPSGKTRRKGIDVSVRYQALPWLYVDADLNLTEPRSIEETEGNDYIPLAPTFTSIGGLSYQLDNGINGSLRYRYLDDRPANKAYSSTAEGYFLLDAVVNYTTKKFEIGLMVENVLDTEWKEAQFETESRLSDEPDPVSEIHFTPGSPFFARMSLSYFF